MGDLNEPTIRRALIKEGEQKGILQAAEECAVWASYSGSDTANAYWRLEQHLRRLATAPAQPAAEGRE